VCLLGAQLVITKHELGCSRALIKPSHSLLLLHCRGRAEVIKLICSAKNIPFEIVDVDFQNMKVDRAAYPFGQCPRMVDGDVDITQSNAMIR
jgi:hypothetical protein